MQIIRILVILALTAMFSFNNIACNKDNSPAPAPSPDDHDDGDDNNDHDDDRDDDKDNDKDDDKDDDHDKDHEKNRDKDLHRIEKIKCPRKEEFKL